MHQLKNVEELEVESLRRALSDGTLQVCGVKLWTALHSDAFHHRDAAIKAYSNYLISNTPNKARAKDGLPDRHKEKTVDLFKASIEIALIGCRDKLLQIYLKGLDILEQTLTPKICGGDVPPRLVDKSIRPFVRLLIDKIGEMNYRGRDRSLNTFKSLFRHPSVELRHAIEGIMDITEKAPGPSKEKQALVQARLEILHYIVKEFGLNENVWDWQIIY